VTARAYWFLVGLFLPLAAGGALEIAIVNPEPGEPVFGEVEIEVEVYPPSAEIDRIEFYLDALRVGLIDRPPYRMLVDAGEGNVEHSFEVLAYDRGGGSARASLRSPRVETDLEISVVLQQLYITVQRAGERVLDLTEDEFLVRDDGVAQDLVTFARGDIPFTAVLLLDASTSMSGIKLPTAVEGAKTFIASMRPLDEAKLLLFCDRVLLETPFTTFSSVLSIGLQGARAQGGTAINDGLYLALKRLEAEQGRKVVVLLSDGVDVESVLPMSRVRRVANLNQAMLYWIRLPRAGGSDTRRFSSWRSDGEHAEEIALLNRTVEESGGRIVNIESIDQVAGALQKLLRELRDQYVLGYYPTHEKGPGSWHDVEVELRRRGLKVRTRAGYLEG
jgi:Ca-activated chloride channel family protein